MQAGIQADPCSSISPVFLDGTFAYIKDNATVFKPNVCSCAVVSKCLLLALLLTAEYKMISLGRVGL